MCNVFIVCSQNMYNIIRIKKRRISGRIIYSNRVSFERERKQNEETHIVFALSIFPIENNAQIYVVKNELNEIQPNEYKWIFADVSSMFFRCFCNNE